VLATSKKTAKTYYAQMSFAAPCSLPMEHPELYSPEEMRRHDVLPGITGCAQVSSLGEATAPKFRGHSAD